MRTPSSTESSSPPWLKVERIPFSSALGPPPRAVRIGQSVQFEPGEPYVLERLLGRGGMGEVYLASRRTASGELEHLAVKVVRPRSVLMGRGVQHFLDEARLHQFLRHPKVVQARAVREEGGVYFLAMDYLPGRSLRALLDLAANLGMSLEESTACHIVAEVAEALGYVHQAIDEQGRPLRVVHRDVSPSNIFITDSGEVKVLDFGVAKSALEGRLETRSSEDGYQGKLTYLSPEQAHHQPLDGRSDLFALGVVFVEMLTGEHLFDIGTALLVLDAIRTVTPEYVERVIKDLPEALKAICHRMLASQPTDRFATGQEVAGALRMYIRACSYRADAASLVKEVAALEELSAGRSWAVEVRARPRSQVPLAAAGALLLLLAGAVTYSLLGRPDADLPPVVLALPRPPSPMPTPTTEEQKPPETPALTATAKKPKGSIAKSCARTGAVGLLVAASGCPIRVPTTPLAGDCSVVPVKEVGGIQLPEVLDLLLISLNGESCKGERGTEPCPAGDGVLVVAPNELYLEDDVQHVLSGARITGRARLVPGHEKLHELGLPDRDAIGREIALMTELQLRSGAKLPICGVLFFSDDRTLADPDVELGREGFPVIARPNGELFTPSPGYLKLKLFWPK